MLFIIGMLALLFYADLVANIIFLALREALRPYRFRAPWNVIRFSIWVYMVFTDGRGFRLLGFEVWRAGLNFKHDHLIDVVTVEGRKFTADFFRCLANPADGMLLRVSNKHGVVSLENALGGLSRFAAIEVTDGSPITDRSQVPAIAPQITQPPIVICTQDQLKIKCRLPLIGMETFDESGRVEIVIEARDYVGARLGYFDSVSGTTGIFWEEEHRINNGRDSHLAIQFHHERIKAYWPDVDLLAVYFYVSNAFGTSARSPICQVSLSNFNKPCAAA